MKKPTQIASRIITDQIIFETKSGSIQISTDPQGRMRIGGYTQNEQDQIIIDPIQKRITAASLVVNGAISAQQYQGLSGIVSNEAIDSLNSKITSEISIERSSRTGSELSLDSRISAEVSSRFSTGLSLDSKISISDFSLGNRISLEAVNRFSSETSLGSRISAETSNRFSSETSLGSRISAETSNRFSSETSLGSRISLETSNRISTETSLTGRISLSDLSLTGRISAETSIRSVSETSLTGRISTETSIRSVSETSLTGRISAETSNRSSSETSLTSRISLSDLSLTGRISIETANRFSSETSLTNRISAETSLRSISETSLTSRISTETANRFSSETSLTGRISTETSSRSSSETSLTGRISTETSNRVSIETSLTSRISIETVNRFSSETSLTSRISAETSIRSVSETSLGSRISAETSLRSISETSLTSRISTETANRFSSETSLTSRISSSDLSLTGRISTSETSLTSRISSSDLSLTGRISTSETSLTGRISTETSSRSSSETSLGSRISLSENVGNSANSLSTLIEGRFTSGLLNVTNAAVELRNSNISLAQASSGQITLTLGGGISPIAINPLTTTTFTNVQTTANTANNTANTINGRFETNGKLKGANLTDDNNSFKFTSSNKLKIGIGQAQTTTNGGAPTQYDSDTDFEIVTGSTGTPDIALLKAQSQGNLTLGQINFKGWDGAQFTNHLGITVNEQRYSSRATIQCSTNNLGGGQIEFFTALEGTYSSIFGGGTPTTPTKRMIITDDGLVAIGTNTPSHRLDINADLGSNLFACRFRNFNSSGNGIIIGAGDNTATRTLISFRNNTNAVVGSITQVGGTVTYSAFTGEHPGFIANIDNDYVYGCVVKIDNVDSVGRNVLYTVSKTTSSYDKKTMGIFAGVESLNLDSDSSFSGSYSIYSLGDGHILVCNEGGDIQIGDYLCSSNTPGVAMKQNDDLLHSYTVAKATENISWNQQITGSVLISCTYHSA